MLNSVRFSIGLGMALTLALACGKTVGTNSDDERNAGGDQSQKPGGDGDGGANGAPIGDAGGSSPTLPEGTELTPCRDLGGGAVHVTAAANADRFLITNPLGARLISTKDFHVERTFTEHFDNTLASTLSSDAFWATTIGDDAVVRFWDAESGRTYAEQELEDVPRALVLPAASGSTQVTALDEAGRVTSFDRSTGDLLWAVELPEESDSTLHANARAGVVRHHSDDCSRPSTDPRVRRSDSHPFFRQNAKVYCGELRVSEISLCSPGESSSGFNYYRSPGIARRPGAKRRQRGSLATLRNCTGGTRRCRWRYRLTPDECPLDCRGSDLWWAGRRSPRACSGPTG